MPKNTALFLIGAVLMRGAGCTINDILDRDLDAQVERTRNRPLPAGDVSLTGAIVFFVFQLLCGLGVLLQFNLATIGLGFAALPLICLYPLMKRITWWPQLFLGLTFNWGVLMGWVAATGRLDWPALGLYLAGVFWTLGYDTIYAQQDIRDDSKSGIKSTALRLDQNSTFWISGFYIAFLMTLIAVAFATHSSPSFYMLLILPAIHLFSIVKNLDPQNPALALDAFRANVKTGALVLMALALA